MASGTCSRPMRLVVEAVKAASGRATLHQSATECDNRFTWSDCGGFRANSGTDTTTRNYPVLSHSNDGAAWKTCGPAFTVAIRRYYPRRVKTSPGCS